ncbi:MAG TPA: NifB/NifX family molybdenum-iron cluster-binding protein [bacterium]|nr:NifB/NifX family molybdenum-iron cluster-binding protein [bacterium]
MRFAISTDGEFVSPHFGRCPSFTIVDIESNKVVKKEVIENPGHHPGYLPEFLHKINVKAIVCGGMGQRAAELFKSFKINVIPGIEGKVVDAVEKLAEDKLASGKSLCTPGAGKNYGLEKTECDHSE